MRSNGKTLTEAEPMSLNRRSTLLALGAAILWPVAGHAAKPLVTVHKDPTCGCCGGWVAHLELHNFPVNVIETSRLNAVKARLGVPYDLHACHTAELDGYIVEGHVPARAIEKLLAERPKARGLAVPGMPLGSPGMTGEFEEYDVILFGPKDAQRVYGRFKGEKEI
jgi:hypothetical protein